MIVKTRDNVLKIRWAHIADVDKELTEKSKEKMEFELKQVSDRKRVQGATRCTIMDMETEKGPAVIAITQAWCSVKDQYSKETGRKVSLTRALHHLKLDKKQRTDVWHAYFNRG